VAVLGGCAAPQFEALDPRARHNTRSNPHGATLGCNTHVIGLAAAERADDAISRRQRGDDDATT
jgi:hypothetical protein